MKTIGRVSAVTKGSVVFNPIQETPLPTAPQAKYRP